VAKLSPNGALRARLINVSQIFLFGLLNLASCFLPALLGSRYFGLYLFPLLYQCTANEWNIPNSVGTVFISMLQLIELNSAKNSLNIRQVILKVFLSP
jgi:hypothetical protein